MQDAPLSLVSAFGRAERLFADKSIVTATKSGRERTTYGAWADRTRRLPPPPPPPGGAPPRGAWADRTRRLATALDDLGVSPDGRVGTFGWNTARHLELYFAAPCSGRVLHTLNIRLFEEQVVYVANHAEDEVLFVDRSLLPLLWKLVDQLETVRHVVVMDDGGDVEVPDDPRIVD